VPAAKPNSALMEARSQTVMRLAVLACGVVAQSPTKRWCIVGSCAIRSGSQESRPQMAGLGTTHVFHANRPRERRQAALLVAFFLLASAGMLALGVAGAATGADPGDSLVDTFVLGAFLSSCCWGPLLIAAPLVGLFHWRSAYDRYGVEVSGAGLRSLKPGARLVLWSEVGRLHDRHWRQRVEVRGRDGRRLIDLKHGLEGLETLIDTVFEHAPFVNPPLPVPVAFRRPWWLRQINRLLLLGATRHRYQWHHDMKDWLPREMDTTLGGVRVERDAVVFEYGAWLERVPYDLITAVRLYRKVGQGGVLGIALDRTDYAGTRFFRPSEDAIFAVYRTLRQACADWRQQRGLPASVGEA
jgi:hypothetical protein